ncbi:MAG: hypothetical protein QF464_15520, partial [Myxococcota bacterium]|nr:hypothetical protein [Myxococcota bacterium]
LARIERARGDWEALDGVLARHLELADGPEAWLPLHVARADLALNERDNPEEALSHIRHTDDLITDTFPDQLVAVLETLTRHPPARHEAARRLEAPYRAKERFDALFEVLQVRLEATGREDNVDLVIDMATVAGDHLGDPRLALSTLLPSFRLAPSHLELRGHVERLAEETQQWDGVIEVGEAALDQIEEASHRGAHARWLGDAMRSHGHPDAAVWAYEQLLEALPTDRGALETLEALHQDAGRHAEQIGALQRQLDALSLPSPERAAVLIRMANIHEAALGDASAARKAALAALDLDPNSASALEVVTRSAREGEDWGTLDDTLARRIALAEDARDRTTLLLERAALALDRRDSPSSALTYVLEADEIEPGGPGHEGVVASLTRLSRIPETQASAAASLERRMEAREDWDGVMRSLRLQLETCDDVDRGETLTRRWAEVADTHAHSPEDALTAWVTGAERFPGRESLWHAAAEHADRLDAWHVVFDAGHRALDMMSASRSKVALGLWLSDRHGDHGGDERGIRHALEHVLRAAPLHDKAFTALEQMHVATQNWT